MADHKPISWVTKVGLNHVGAYQVSGAPFATGSIDCTVHADGTYKVQFPSVTSWVQIINNDINNYVKVGFSDFGLRLTDNFFKISKLGSQGRHPVSGKLDLKVSEIWISGSTDVSIVAGLTNIESNKTNTSKGTNWSGSVGVG